MFTWAGAFDIPIPKAAKSPPTKIKDFFRMPFILTSSSQENRSFTARRLDIIDNHAIQDRLSAAQCQL